MGTVLDIRKPRQAGASLLESAALTALVAIVALGAIYGFSKGIRRDLCTSISALEINNEEPTNTITFNGSSRFGTCYRIDASVEPRSVQKANSYQ